ncbi:hypothetical protein BJF78_28610 [Pseudonocardia sp. CNS-139]|nr:hypothetical protein BJF78_28610 [Pseudonocardia sp. CNS-139]
MSRAAATVGTLGATAGLVLVAVLVPASGAARSLWGDEAFTATAAARPFGATLGLLAHQDGGIAGYLLLMNRWIALFGASEVALRVPSLLATAVTVVAAAVLGRHVGSRGAVPARAPVAGMLAALLVAVHPQVVGTYATEARPYALATAGVTVAAAAWAVAARRPRPGPVLLGCAAAAFALTQHFLTAAALVFLVPWLLRARGGADRRTRLWLHAGAVGVGAVAVVMAWSSRRTYLQGWIPLPDPLYAVSMVASLLSPAGGALLLLGAVLLLVGCGRGALVVPLARLDGGVLLAWAAGPFLLLLGYSLVAEPAVLVRYLLSSAVAFQVLAAAALAAGLPAARRGAVLLVATVAVVAVTGTVLVRSRVAVPGEDLRAAAAGVLAQRGTPSCTCPAGGKARSAGT